MNVNSLARGLAINRISFGVGLILAPGLYARSWVGSKAAEEETTKVLARALGARDLALGAGGFLALRHEDSERARRWFTAQGVTDAVDFLATIAARDIPLPARVFAAAMAAGSAAIAAAYVRSATEQRPHHGALETERPHA
jgi:MoxR-like ATPase